MIRKCDRGKILGITFWSYFIASQSILTAGTAFPTIYNRGVKCKASLTTYLESQQL